MFDVFGYLINLLVLNGAIDSDKCNLWVVAQRLPDSTLKNKLDQLTEDDWFRYVSAFVNLAKHRWLAPQLFRVDFDAGTAVLQIAAFTYKGSPFKSCSVNELLRGLVGVKNRIVQCGTALNDMVLSP